MKSVNNVVGKHGFVRLVDLMPRITHTDLKCDEAIVQAARVSYSSGTKNKRSDSSLIKYLLKNNHTSPFEMVEFKFHIKAPLFIVRQWQRHRMSSYNEISGRYSVLSESFWEPTNFRRQSEINKQGSEQPISEPLNWTLINEYNNHIKGTYSFYEYLLKQGVSREMARCVLPLSVYTEFYWKIDLHNLLRFISLRSDSHAQLEIREYSDVIKKIVSEYCPVTVCAFDEYITDSIRLSKTELIALKTDNTDIIDSKSGIEEFKKKLILLEKDGYQ
jgi:thymidylate synthase (FAD)